MFKSNNINHSTFLGLAAIVLWSTTVAMARSISEQVGPITAGALVYLVAGIFMIGWRFFKKNAPATFKKLPKAYLFGCGALFIIYTVALFLSLGLALDRQQALEVGLINYLWPALTILFSLFLLSARANFWLIPATAMALLGIFLVLTQGSTFSWQAFKMNLWSNPLAYGLGLLAAISWALYSNLARRWAGQKGEGGVPLFILASGLIFAAAILFFPEESRWSMEVVIEILLLALATALAYAFWDIAMRKGDLLLVASASYFTPLLSTVVSSIYLSVLPGLNLWVGCLLIIGGALLSWWSVKR